MAKLAKINAQHASTRRYECRDVNLDVDARSGFDSLGPETLLQ